MEKLNGQSMNLTENNIDNLKQLFPEVFSEGKIDFDKLRLVLGDNIEENDERYQFTWNGKSEAIKNAQTPSMGTLRPDKESSKNWDNTENLYIEGDNLEVLKLLQKSYFGKIKMIYIDPPYNTGKDFVYKDNFRDSIANYKEITNQSTKAHAETSGRYHTDWLNMMYPRLKLARNLLREDGVIFISIDDNEVTNLKKLCDEIFGEENFISQMSIITGANQSGDGVKIQKNIEYCIVYSKNQEKLNINRVDKTNETLRNLNDAPTPLETRLDMGYSVYYNEESEDFIPIKDYDKDKVDLNDEKKVYTDNEELLSKGYVPIRPGKRNNKLHRWRWGIETFLERKKEIIILNKNGKYSIYFKQQGYNAPKNYQNFSGGALDLRQIFGDEKLFDYPKGISFIKYLISIGIGNDDIVIDFFSGSCTTAHAVMQLNAEDDGNRKFIMVQLPESTNEKSEAYKAGYSNICEIGKERIRRAGEKILSESGKTDLDIGFKVFKLDDSNIKEWSPNYDNLEFTLDEMTDNLKSGRTKEDLLYEILIKMGIELTAPIEEINIGDKKIYNIGMGSLILCLEDEITEDIIKEIPKYKSYFVDMKVVFKENGFKTDSQKMNAMQNLKQFGITDVRSV